jgi:hypothetical protein
MTLAMKKGSMPLLEAEEDAAKEYTEDRVLGRKLSKDLSPVTGKLDAGATALFFDMMTTDVSGALDLWDYGEALDIHKPLRFIIGCSSLCAVRKDMKSHPEKMKSRYRGIVVVARLADPYGIWIR